MTLLEININTRKQIKKKKHLFKCDYKIINISQ